MAVLGRYKSVEHPAHSKAILSCMYSTVPTTLSGLRDRRSVRQRRPKRVFGRGNARTPPDGSWGIAARGYGRASLLGKDAGAAAEGAGCAEAAAAYGDWKEDADW